MSAKDLGGNAPRSPASRMLAHLGFGRAVFLGSLLCLATIWLTVGAVMVQMYRDVWRDAALVAEDVAILVAKDVNRSVDVYDLSLKGVAAEAADDETMRLPDHFRRKVIFDESARASGFGTMLILDSSGTVVDSSSGTVPKQSFADRDYFKALRDGKDAGLYVTRPFKSRLSGVQVIVLARRIESSDGRFEGVATGAIRLDYFKDLLAAVRLPPDSAITLFFRDGMILAQLPAGTSEIDSGFVFPKDMPPGDFRQRVRVGDDTRLFLYHRTPGASILPGVSLSSAQILRSFWQRAVVLGLGLGVLSAVIIGLALVLARQWRARREAERALVDLAELDPLTAVANRRKFDKIFNTEHDRAVRGGTPISLVMIDIDFFKAFNDSYGHSAGDRALKAITQALKAGLFRSPDLLARLGGEEFGILLPETDEEGAAEVAERLREMIENLALPHEGSANGRLTISAGYATDYPSQSGGDLERLIEAADAALYAGKARGRNRTERHTLQIVATQ